jgi:hypothetical protein
MTETTTEIREEVRELAEEVYETALSVFGIASAEELEDIKVTGDLKELLKEVEKYKELDEGRKLYEIIEKLIETSNKIDNILDELKRPLSELENIIEE